MAEPSRERACKREAQRRQSGDDVDLEGRQLEREIVRDRFHDREARLVENERGERVFAIGERANGQPERAPVVEQGGVEEGAAALRIDRRGGLDLLPEFVRLHRLFTPGLARSFGAAI